MEDFIIVSQVNTFIILQVVRINVPNDSWFIEARYCAEKQTYLEAVEYIESMV